MPPIQLTYTAHAEEMIVERQLERRWIEQTIAEPETLEQDPSRPGVLQAFRRIPEHGGRMLRVAYVTSGQSVRVITAFFDRRRR